MTSLQLFPIIANANETDFLISNFIIFPKKVRLKKNGFDLFVHLIILEAHAEPENSRKLLNPNEPQKKT